jgi:hypothetical protein
VKIIVTKLDAARRQLNSAVRLWFADGDPVAIHTLAYAAHEIIHAIFRSRGFKGLMFDSPRVRKDKRGMWSKTIRKAPNWFKHARDDLHGSFEFETGLNELLLGITAAALVRMGEPQTVEGAAIGWWMYLHHPDLFIEDGFLKSLDVQVVEGLKRAGRSEFFEAFTQAWGRGLFREARLTWEASAAAHRTPGPHKPDGS